jgi:maltose-binding protein MalE
MTFTNLGDNEDMALQSLFGQKQFYPRCGAGVVAASKQQMLAEDFIALLLSSEVQDSNLFDGFPVNRASLQKILDDLSGMTRDMRGTQLNDMDFIALCESLTEPLFTDETVKAAVAAQMKNLLNGSMTPEQAAAKIVADTKLYLAE